MIKLIKILLSLSVTIFIFAYFFKNKLPKVEDIFEELYHNPVQTETILQPFEVDKSGYNYTIQPLYEYQLFGLVTSYHHSKSWFDYYHKAWGDFLNAKDICVIWGDNLNPEIIKNVTFKSGSWTCYFRTKNQKTWNRFKLDQISNNHLLSDDREIAKTIMQIKKWDQIYLKGYLVDYRHDQGFHRKTSTTRNDRGGGACETLFVTDCQILKKANPFWNTLYRITKYLIIICVLIVIIQFLFGPMKNK